MARELTKLGADGFLFDCMFHDGLLEPPCDPNKVKEQDIPANIRENWTDGMITLVEKIKKAIGPNKLFFFNAGWSASVDKQRPIIERADGFMLEDTANIYSDDLQGNPVLSRMKPVLELAEQLNKYVIFTINPAIVGYPTANQPFLYANTSLEEQQRLARYYLAFFLNFFRSPKMMLSYFTPMIKDNYYNSEAYFADWDLKIGKLLGSATEVSPGVYHRLFEKADIWWNNADTSYEVNLGKEMTTADGYSVITYTLEGKSGMLFVTPDILEPYNPSFETVWNWQPNGETGIEVQMSVVHSGQRAIKIPSGLKSSPGLAEHYYFQPNTTYTWSAWVKTEGNANPSTVAVAAPPGATTTTHKSAIGSDGKVLINDNLLPIGTQDWQKISMRFTTKEGGQGIVYAVVNGESNGIVYFDDVQVIAGASAPIPGDANGDGRVDSEDFSLLVEDYLNEPTHNTDFNDDGRVDSEDFAILQTNYLK